MRTLSPKLCDPTPNLLSLPYGMLLKVIFNHFGISLSEAFLQIYWHHFVKLIRTSESSAPSSPTLKPSAAPSSPPLRGLPSDQPDFDSFDFFVAGGPHESLEPQDSHEPPCHLDHVLARRDLILNQSVLDQLSSNSANILPSCSIDRPVQHAYLYLAAATSSSRFSVAFCCGSLLIFFMMTNGEIGFR